MNVLFFTDVHGNKKHLKEVVKKSENADLLVCCGDITNLGNGFEEMMNELKNTGKKVLIIPGNNETPEFLKEGVEDYKNVIVIEEEVYQDLNIKFLGIGGSIITPFNTPYELTEEDYKRKLEKFKDDITVLVSHSPPKNTILDRTPNGLHVGSFEIGRWIKKNQPKYCCCGHVHENAGKKVKIGQTLCFNPGAKGEVIRI